MTKLFSGIEPTKYIWVSPSGSDTNSGAHGSPLQTIQAAVDLAKTSAYGPGTAIMVREGTYNETVDLTLAGGTPTAPVWLISADGVGKAKVVADATGGAFTASSTSNMVIRGFEIDGGDSVTVNGDGNGIQFTGGLHPVQNILIEDNYIYGCSFDGIKFADADNVQVINNKIDHSIATDPPSSHEGIDFVGVTNSQILYNVVMGGPKINSGITVKSGSENVLIEGNYVDGLADGGGIKVGGNGNHSGAYMAKDVVVRGNHVGSTSDSSIVFMGAIDALAEDNYVRTIKLQDNPFGIQTDNITLTDNYVRQSTYLYNPAGATYTEAGTVVNGTWTGSAGQVTGFYDPILGTVESPFRDVSEWETSGAFTTTFSGGSGADTLTGTNGNDKLDGKSGIDTMTGLGGDDTYFVSGALDKVIENAGEGIDTVRAFGTNYALAANVENLEIGATTGYTATGNGLANIIVGNTGADVIKGLGGEDRITGGAGADVFVYDSVNDKGDVITDFQVGVDTLDLVTLMGGLTGPTEVYTTVQSDGVTLFVDNGGQHHALVHLLGVTTTLTAGADYLLV